MCTHVQRCQPGQQGQVWKIAAGKALYLQYKLLNHKCKSIMQPGGFMLQHVKVVPSCLIN